MSYTRAKTVIIVTDVLNTIFFFLFTYFLITFMFNLASNLWLQNSPPHSTTSAYKLEGHNYLLK